MLIKDTWNILGCCRWSANGLALCFGILHTAFYSLTNDIAFQFAEYAHHFEHSLGHWVKFFAAIHNESAKYQFDMLIFGKLDNIAKLFCTSGNSADLCCNNCIAQLHNTKQFCNSARSAFIPLSYSRYIVVSVAPCCFSSRTCLSMSCIFSLVEHLA